MRHLLYFLLLACSLTATADRVAPLLNGWVRHQLAPFNSCCPQWTDIDGTTYAQRCKVGCVATALEEIVSFHRRPIVLRDSIAGWKTPHYTMPSIPAGLRIETANILPQYVEGAYSETEADAVARLSLVLGAMAKMNYGLEESGANLSTLLNPLKTVMGWLSATLIDSYKYTPNDWEELLRRELRKGRPILYTGYTQNLFGHAFVVDGCDDEGRFHFNFGFNGTYDEGWFPLSAFNTFEHPDDCTPLGVQQGFFCNQMALLLAPDSVDFELPDTLTRTGNEVVVENVELLATPETGKFTPLRLTFRNRSPQTLTTPFEIFTNLPTDSLIFQQADYAALCGTTLQPNEQCSLTIDAKFSQSGERLLRLSPDDAHIAHEQTISITTGTPAELHFGTPSIAFIDSTTVRLTLPISNKGAGRSGDLVTFCLMPTTDIVNEGDTRHYAYAYLAPNETLTFSVEFRHLNPGSTHTFAVRSPWKIQQQTTFTVPTPTGIEMPHRADRQPNSPHYLLSGRRANRAQSGIMITPQGAKHFQR